MDTYRHLCASALAAIVVLRSALAAVFPLFTEKMFQSLGDQWGLTVFAILSLVCAPFPFLFYVSQHSPLFVISGVERLDAGPREANSGRITFRQRVREEGSHRLKVSAITLAHLLTNRTSSWLRQIHYTGLYTITPLPHSWQSFGG